jgi:hypothetical protein
MLPAHPDIPSYSYPPARSAGWFHQIADSLRTMSSVPELLIGADKRPLVNDASRRADGSALAWSQAAL